MQKKRRQVPWPSFPKADLASSPGPAESSSKSLGPLYSARLSLTPCPSLCPYSSKTCYFILSKLFGLKKKKKVPQVAS